MSGVLIAFEIVLLLPLFIGTWRISLLGLSCQGFLMAWIAFHHGLHLSLDSAVELVRSVAPRAIAGPALLYAVLLRQNAPRRNDVRAQPAVVGDGVVLCARRLPCRRRPGHHSEGDAQTWVWAWPPRRCSSGCSRSGRARASSVNMVGALRIRMPSRSSNSPDAHHSSVGVWRMGRARTSPRSRCFDGTSCTWPGGGRSARLSPPSRAMTTLSTPITTHEADAPPAPFAAPWVLLAAATIFRRRWR